MFDIEYNQNTCQIFIKKPNGERVEISLEEARTLNEKLHIAVDKVNVGLKFKDMFGTENLN